ncbi:hypothetical protein M0Q57_004562 [Vibrio parahaemolyticus]|nr:hypothetical protein [Vibrio parahaemolyticus]
MSSDIFEFKRDLIGKNEPDLEVESEFNFEDVELGDEIGADFLSSEDDEFPSNDDFLFSDGIELELESDTRINKFLPPSKVSSFKTDLFAALKLGVDFKTFFDFESKKQGWKKGDVVHVPLTIDESDMADVHNSVGSLRNALIQARELDVFFGHREHVMRPMNLRSERVVSPLAREANYIAKLIFSRLIGGNRRIDITVDPSKYSNHRNIAISDMYFVHSVDLVSLIPDLLALMSEANYPQEQLSMNFTSAFVDDADHQAVLADFDSHGLSFWREGNSNRMMKVFVYKDDGSVVVREIKIDGQPRRGTMLAENRPYSSSVVKHLPVFNSAANEMQDDALSIREADSVFESIPWKFRCREKPYFVYDSSIEAFVIRVH